MRSCRMAIIRSVVNRDFFMSILLTEPPRVSSKLGAVHSPDDRRSDHQRGPSRAYRTRKRESRSHGRRGKTVGVERRLSDRTVADALHEDQRE